MIAKLLGYRAVEVPVIWNNVEGTKVSKLAGVSSFAAASGSGGRAHYRTDELSQELRIIGRSIAPLRGQAVVNIMNLTPYVILWAICLESVCSRFIASSGEEDQLVHLAAGEESRIPHQVALAPKIDVVDRWVKTLTVVTMVAAC